MVRSFQGICEGYEKGEIIKGTDAFFFIHRYKVHHQKVKDFTYDHIACTIREMKKEKHRTRTTVGGNKIKYDRDVGTPIYHLETSKIFFNSVPSRPNAKPVKIDISNFYLMTPMKDYVCLRMYIQCVPCEIIEEHNLSIFVHNGWAHADIRKVDYGLPQAGILAKELLENG